MKLNDINQRLSQLINLMLFISALGILLATSESDIPSADSQRVEQFMGKETQSRKFQINFTKGPFAFNSLPLLLEMNIAHTELNEDFDFDGQSWTLITSTPEGESSKRRVLFRRGVDDILYADRGKFTLQGTTSLYQCPDGSTNQTEDACIPCELDVDDCSVAIELVREGAPYPAETISVQASQWLLNDASSIQIELIAR